MNPFFASEGRLQALRFHAAELLDTPFAPHAMVPGAGMDCIGVPAWVYIKTGLLKEFKAPAYTLDGGKHTDQSKVLAWLAASEHFARAPLAHPIPGDVLCFRQRRTEHHVGLMITELDFIHSVEKYGVIKTSLNEPIYRAGLTAVFRPVQAEVPA